jgi:hypothetical protein
VDYVSEESEIAGRAAANYINNVDNIKTNIILTTDGKIRYTVPSIITEACDVKVYFRVADIYSNVKIKIKSHDKVIYEKKKAKVAPGEMETITLKKELLSNITNLHFELEEL